MKHFLLISALVLTMLVSLPGRAQNVNIVTSLDLVDGVTITQPSELTSRLERADVTTGSPAATHVTAVSTKNGYRIEVYADNNRNAKTQAADRQARVQSRFPQYRVYTIFEAPFWRVRLGDFRSRNEATDVMTDVKRAFPSYSPYLRVVRDRIN